METSSAVNSQENEVLLPGPTRIRSRKAFLPRLNNWSPRPVWLLPIVLVISMSRGVTMSPRIQVYKAIACRVLNQSDKAIGLKLNQVSASTLDCSGSAIQARAAKIQASVVTLMNILSAVTTGFWSRLGDAYGRKPIFAFFLIGAIAMEFVHILVMDPESIPGRHAETFILVGPIMEGLVGALSSFNGVVHAYISDCTRHGSRSKIFSTVQGIVFVGLAIGPWFSGLVLPESTILKVDDAFFLSISLMAVTLVYVILAFPESRQPTAYEYGISVGDNSSFKRSPVLVLRRYLGRFVSALIIPITMFAPRSMPNQSYRKNYNLTLLGVGLFIYLVSTGVYQSKYLYAQHVYDWTTAQLGYYMSLLWITRAFNLLVLLPIIISYLKPKLPSGGIIPGPENVAAEMRFDKLLAQCSLGLDCIADSLVTLVPSSSQTTFIGLSCLSSFTSGGNPALHSLGAVCLHACGFSSEVGSLFGGMAVLSAIAHIISPYIYALTYSSTVAHFPKAIFSLAAVLLALVVIFLGGISTGPEEITILSASPVDGADDETVQDMASLEQRI